MKQFQNGRLLYPILFVSAEVVGKLNMNYTMQLLSILGLGVLKCPQVQDCSMTRLLLLLRLGSNGSL